MKLPVTDKFLQDVYANLEKIGDLSYFLLRPRRTMRDLPPDIETPWERRYLKEMSREQFAKLIYYLKKNNYIRVKNLENKKAIFLTSKGARRVLKNKFKTSHKNYQQRKDGKWVMILFDVPRKDNKKRDLLRSVLRNLGYQIFQQSVWINKCDVIKKTEEMLQFYVLDKYVKMFLIEKI